METAFLSLLLNNAAIIAALGDRVNWGLVPQENRVYPYAVLQVINVDIDYTMQAPSGLETTRIQVDVYGETYKSTYTAALAVSGLLSGYRGTVIGTKFKGVFLDAKRDLPAADAGDVTNLFRKSLDFIIWHT